MNDGSALLTDIERFIRRYVVVSSAESAILATWIVHSYLFDLVKVTPYLAITSAEKQCGKTLLLEVLAVLVREPLLVSGASPAALFRSISKKRPTLLLDEMDATFAGDKEMAQAIRLILNSGHRANGKVIRCGQHGETVDEFSTYCPKAIAAVGKLPETLTDRSLVIRLRRRAPEEAVGDFLNDDGVEKEADALRARTKSWAGAIREKLGRPERVDGLRDRTFAGVRQLLAIADAAGPPWPHRLRAAVVEVANADAAEDQSPGVRLLADLRDFKAVRQQDGQPVDDRWLTSEVLEYLASIEDAPWSEWNRGKPMTARQLANLLRPFGIRPAHWRDCRGYAVAEFEDAWRRYLPPVAPSAEESQASQASQGPFHAGSSLTSSVRATNGSVTYPERVTDATHHLTDGDDLEVPIYKAGDGCDACDGFPGGDTP
jgi:hypothetical protein